MAIYWQMQIQLPNDIVSIAAAVASNKGYDKVANYIAALVKRESEQELAWAKPANDQPRCCLQPKTKSKWLGWLGWLSANKKLAWISRQAFFEMDDRFADNRRQTTLANPSIYN